MRYNECGDEELIELYRAGDEQAIEVIFERYKGVVRKKARAMYIAGGDSDDLIQEGMIGLYKAARDYNESKNAAFATFASMCINRNIITAVEASNRKKNAPLNSYVSFDTPANGEADRESNGMKLEDVLVTGNGQDPESLYIDKEHTANLEERIEKILSAFEKNVLEMYMEGQDYIQIAAELGKTPKSIDNALQRIRQKVGKEN